MAPLPRKSPRKYSPSKKAISTDKATTSSKKQSTLPQTKKARGPLRCQRCPDHPLLKECPVHSAKRKRPTTTSLKQENPALDPLTPQPPSIPPGTVLDQDCLTPQASEPPSEPPSTIPDQEEENSESSIHPDLRTPRRPHPFHGPQIPRLNLFPQLSSGRDYSPVAQQDMGVGTPSSSPVCLPGTLPPSSPPPSSPVMSSTLLSRDSVHSSPSPGTRIRPTAANPFHGMVEGAMQGSKQVDIVRQHEPRPPATVLSAASRRFRAEIRDIIERCERLSAETNCWLFVAGQHSQAASSNSFYHYASPNLRQDAYPQTSELVNNFGAVVEALLLLNKQKVIELNMRSGRMEREKMATEEEAKQVRAELAAKAEQAALLTSILERIADSNIGKCHASNCMAENEAQQSPQPTTEDKGKATNPHPISPAGVVIEILGAKLCQLNVASDCKYCDVATFRQEWPLFPAQELLAGMREDEDVVQWTESGTDRRHMICRACIRGCIQSIIDERRTCSGGWHSGGWHWGVEGCDGCSPGWGEPEHLGVEGDGDGVGWGFSDAADEEGPSDAVDDPWGTGGD
ncbi:hypothetical protein FPV67DRAFT_1448800 [Lyophyllum atratum]|nr:hypothetical protein FPV67DRAFT_1448800 [Lyophyllum atratum]